MRSRGVTLVELVVVLGVLATLALVAVPFLVDLAKDVGTRGQVRALVTEIRTCRQEAIGNNLAPVVVTIDPAGLTCDGRLRWPLPSGWVGPTRAWSYGGAFASTQTQAPLVFTTPAGLVTLYVRAVGSVAAEGPQ